MTVETVSPLLVVTLVVLGALAAVIALLSYWWQQYKKFWRQGSEPDQQAPPNPVDPKFAAKLYGAYIAEVVRLAGYNPKTFLGGQDLMNGGVVLDLIVTAEGLLLHSIVEQLKRPLPTEVPPERHMTPKEVHERYSPTPHAAARELAADERLWDQALMLLKKINPVLQQVAGAWVAPKTG